jgi:hypothetical protein
MGEQGAQTRLQAGSAQLEPVAAKAIGQVYG